MLGHRSGCGRSKRESKASSTSGSSCFVQEHRGARLSSPRESHQSCSPGLACAATSQRSGPVDSVSSSSFTILRSFVALLCVGRGETLEAVSGSTFRVLESRVPLGVRWDGGTVARWRPGCQKNTVDADADAVGVKPRQLPDYDLDPGFLTLTESLVDSLFAERQSSGCIPEATLACGIESAEQLGILRGC